MQTTGETLVAPLAFPVLDVFVFTPFAIANQCVDVRISDAKVITPGIGAGVVCGGDAFLTTMRAFALRVGDNVGVGFQDCQGDPRFATWTDMWRSWFPFSRAICFE